MKKVLMVSLMTVIMAAGYADAYTVEERVFDGITPARTEWDSGVSGSDTLQAQHPDHIIVEQHVYNNGWVASTGPMWGEVTTYDAVTDAGGDWWAYGSVPSTIGVDGVGDGMIAFTLTDWYESESGHQFDGWTLNNITILVGEQSSTAAINYNFRIEVRDKTTWAWSILDIDPITAGVQEWLLGGSDQAGHGTKIVIDNINMDNIRGVRITSNGLWQANDVFWGQPLISEIDVEMIPEPATMLLLGLGGFLLRRKLN